MPRSAVLCALPPTPRRQSALMDASARNAVPVSIRLDVGVLGRPRMSTATRRRVVLAPLVLRRRHDVEMKWSHAGPVPAQVIDGHAVRHLHPLEDQERVVSGAVSASVVHDPVGVAVVGQRGCPLPASCRCHYVQAVHESFEGCLRFDEEGHALHITTGRH